MFLLLALNNFRRSRCMRKLVFGVFFHIGLIIQLMMVYVPAKASDFSQDESHCGHNTNSSKSTTNVKISRLSLLSQKIQKTEQDITIEEGESLLIDKNLDLGILTIHGTLRCPATGNFVLKAEAIMIHGQKALLECGTAEKRFQGRLEIQLKDGRELSKMEGKRVLSVMDGGTLRLFGREKNFQWQRIQKTVEAGDTQVVTEKPVDWSIGETLILGPTGFVASEAESRLIKNVSSDRRTITVSEPFRFRHNGQSYSYSTPEKSSFKKQWNLDARAEIAVLDRNIIIKSAGDPIQLDKDLSGGHVMVMATAKAYVDGVQFSRLGQLGVMGRYPFHWHWAGNVRGQFIKNSSIHHSYQRCVTIHGTHEALVENNVCYNHFGHGFFLENGNEINNKIIGNLGMLTKRVAKGKGLLASDMGPINHPRFAGPSTFWITHPTNIVRDNVSSGSDGSGFWMSFVSRLKCAPGGNCDFAENPKEANVFPVRADTTDFSSNTAHSSEVGITWDGAEEGPLMGNPLNPRAREITMAHYAPQGGVQKFNDLVVYKNIFAGVYFRGESVLFSNMIAADNNLSLFFAYNQAVHDSLIVGMSPNFQESEIATLIDHKRGMDVLDEKNTWANRPISGALLYDGPFELKRVHFADFGPRKVMFGKYDYTPVPFYNGGGAGRWVNNTQQLTFSPEPSRRVHFMDKDQWHDTLWTTGLRDHDGSLTGTANTLVVPDHPLNRDPSCRDFDGALACDYSLGIVTAVDSQISLPYSAMNVPFEVIRSDGAKNDLRTNQPYHNKTGLILDKGYTYQLVFKPGILRKLRLQLYTEQVGLVSPPIELVGLGEKCVVENAKRVDSYSKLGSDLNESYNGNLYFQSEDGRQFIRLGAGDSYDRTKIGVTGVSKHLSVACGETGLLDPYLFDEPYYRQAYPELLSLSSQQIKNHWLSEGIRLGHQASSTFAVKDYLFLNSDVRAAFGSNYEAAINHYLNYGARENRSTVLLAKGYIDRIDEDQSIYGWSCIYGIEESVGIEVYAGGPVGLGNLIATVKANFESEMAVSSVCGTKTTQHRYSIKIPSEVFRQFKGSKVYVYATFNGKRLEPALNNSGQRALQ